MSRVGLSLTALAFGGVTLLSAEVAGAQGFTNVDWLIIQPDIGVSYANLYALRNDGLIPGYTNSKGFGPRFGASLGMRFGPVSFGARGAIARYEGFDVGTLGPWVEVRFPLLSIQPFVNLGLGYAWLGDVNPDSALWTCTPSGAASARCPSIRGWHVGLGGGLDVTITRNFTLGAAIDVTVLNLTRGASPTVVNLQQTGDSLGIQATLLGRAALRF